MRTKQTTVYGITELPEEAQETAYYEWLNGHCYFWADDNEKTLNAFVNVFPVKIKNWSYGGREQGVNWEFAEPEYDYQICDMSGIRLLKYLYNNYFTDLFKGKYYHKGKSRHSRIIREHCCVLSGYCIDEDILQPIYDFLKKPCKNTTFEDLMGECLENWVIACAKDQEHSTSMEAFIEDCEANGMEFTISGNAA